MTVFVHLLSSVSLSWAEHSSRVHPSRVWFVPHRIVQISFKSIFSGSCKFLNWSHPHSPTVSQMAFETQFGMAEFQCINWGFHVRHIDWHNGWLFQKWTGYCTLDCLWLSGSVNLHCWWCALPGRKWVSAIDQGRTEWPLGACCSYVHGEESHVLTGIHNVMC